MKKIKGQVWKYGNNIDTDAIIPARYLNSDNPDELAKHCLEDLDEKFADNVKNGDLIVAGKNFGCGSSREHAPLALKASGISCVIAESFARIFYRNSINIGLPILESSEAANNITKGDLVKVDIDAGEIKNISKNENYKAKGFPTFIQELINSDGLINYVQNEVGNDV